MARRMRMPSVAPTPIPAAPPGESPFDGELLDSEGSDKPVVSVGVGVGVVSAPRPSVVLLPPLLCDDLAGGVTVGTGVVVESGVVEGVVADGRPSDVLGGGSSRDVASCNPPPAAAEMKLNGFEKLTSPGSSSDDICIR
jgi:hypothetical protein